MRFRLKITLCFLALLAVCYAAGGSLLISITYDRLLTEAEDQLAEQYWSLLSAAKLLSDSGSASLTMVSQTLDALGGELGIQVLDSDGAEVAAWGSFPQLDTALYQEATQSAAAMKVLTAEDGEHYLQLAGQTELEGEAYYIVLARSLEEGVYGPRDTMVRAYRLIFAVLMAAGAILCYLLALLLTLPLGRLRRTVKSLAAGELQSRAPVESRDEIGDLARDVNQMAERMEESFGDLQTSMERQELFMGSFAHELKTPMTSIIGYADLIRGQSLSPKEQQESANYIFSEGKRLESLSLKLLDLLVVKKEDFTFPAVSVKALLEDTIALLRPNLAEARIRLRYHFAVGTCCLEPDLTKSLVVNLIDNARKALEPGGEIVVTSSMTETGCVIQVADNGRGMAPEELGKITQAFYRVDKNRSRAQGGAGLGLSLCREIAALHKGAIKFQSAPGKGTIVTVTLNGGREK